MDLLIIDDNGALRVFMHRVVNIMQSIIKNYFVLLSENGDEFRKLKL